jgi:hypothetical protein
VRFRIGFPVIATFYRRAIDNRPYGLWFIENLRATKFCRVADLPWGEGGAEGDG